MKAWRFYIRSKICLFHLHVTCLRTVVLDQPSFIHITEPIPPVPMGHHNIVCRRLKPFHGSIFDCGHMMNTDRAKFRLHSPLKDCLEWTSGRLTCLEIETLSKGCCPMTGLVVSQPRERNVRSWLCSMNRCGDVFVLRQLSTDSTGGNWIVWDIQGRMKWNIGF